MLFKTPSTESALRHFSAGVAELKLVAELKTASAEEKTIEATRLENEAIADREVAEHATRVADRFTHLVS